MGDGLIVGLSGYAQTGKDEAAKVLVGLGFTQGSVTDIMRDVLGLLNPIVELDGTRWRDVMDRVDYDEAKKTYPEIRALLQRLGFDVRDGVFGTDFWVRMLLDRVPRPFVFSSCRDPFEAQLIKNSGGVIWRVNRPGYGPANDHRSETAMNDWGYDEVIRNDSSLDDFRDKVQLLGERLLVGESG